MKCQYCGSNIKKEDIACPYCGKVNVSGVNQKKTLENMREGNARLKNLILLRNREKLIFRIWTYINIALILIFIVLFIVFEVQGKSATRRKGIDTSRAAIEKYYEAGDMENLYYSLSEGEKFSSDSVDEGIRHAALIYSKYETLRCDYGRLLEDLRQGEEPGEYLIKSVVESACRICSGGISSVYKGSEMTDEIFAKTQKYRDEAYLILTGTFKVPDDMIAEMNAKSQEDDYTFYEDILDYVKEGLKNE